MRMRTLFLLSLLTLPAIFAGTGAATADKMTSISTTKQQVVSHCGASLTSSSVGMGCMVACGSASCNYHCDGKGKNCGVVIFLAGNGWRGAGAAAPDDSLAERLPVALPPPSLSVTMSGGGTGIVSPKVQPNRPAGGAQ